MQIQAKSQMYKREVYESSKGLESQTWSSLGDFILNVNAELSEAKDIVSIYEICDSFTSHRKNNIYTYLFFGIYYMNNGTTYV